MSIRHKIFLGFGVVVLIGAIQGLYLLRNTNQISNTVDVVFAKPFTAVESARGAWSQFRHVKDHVTSVTSMTTPIESDTSLTEFKRRYGAFQKDIAKLESSSLSENSSRLIKDIQNNSQAWQQHALILLGSSPATSIPAPHLMHRLEAAISKKLDTMVDVTLADAAALKTEIASSITSSLYIATGFMVIAVVLGALLAFIIGMSIVKPLQRLMTTMDHVAAGDNAHEIAGVGRKDEIGKMAAAVAVFRDSAVERVRLESEKSKEQATAAMRQTMVDDLIKSFREEITSTLALVKDNTDRMEATAQTLSGTATQTTEQAHGAASASDEAGQNVQAVAAAAEQLSASISEISRQASETTDIVTQATNATEATDTKVASLAEAAGKISDVLSLIQDIAEQTNLLALNATIEAARAGEAGKGFAVVASEVKELAIQTGKATEGIADQVAAIQTETSDAVEAIREIGRIMKDVTANTYSIAAAVEQQGSSTSEISRNVQLAATGASEATQNISGVTASADGTSQSAAQMLEASQEVAQRAGQLEQVIDGFLEKVAAA